MAFDLQAYLHDCKQRVDASLDELISGAPDIPAPLREAMRYSLLAPGKRLRPALVLMAARAAGDDSNALAAAAAVEMVHTYSLIHDDLPAMDDDDLRRGLPTCHKRFGEAIAILAGDALLTLAFQVLADHYAPVTAAACCRELARAAGAAGMVGGQVADLQAAAGPQDLAALEGIHRHKTGALFCACLALGMWAALGQKGGTSNMDLAHRLRTYGTCFGLVFQITDDLIDVEGDEARTGKRVQKDAERGKLTYPGLLGVAESRRHAAELAQMARAAVEPLGAPAAPLRALLDFVLARDR